MAVLHDARLLVDFIECGGRQRALAKEGGGREDAILLHHESASGEEPCTGRCRRGCHGCTWLSGIARSGDRRGAVAMEYHTSERRTRRGNLAESWGNGTR